QAAGTAIMNAATHTPALRRAERTLRAVIHFSQGVDKTVETPRLVVDGSGKVVIRRGTTLNPPPARHTPPTTVVDDHPLHDLRRRCSSTSSTDPMDETNLHISIRSTAQLGTARSVDCVSRSTD